MDGQAKVQLILEMKERLKTGFTKAKEVVNSNVRDIKNRLADLKLSHIKAFQAMKDEIPGFGRAMELLGNPYVRLISGVIALGIGYKKAIAAAEQFDNSFLNIQNLNLDKSKRQISDLKNEILDFSFKKGFDPDKTAGAVFDVQSLTGKYGSAAEAIVGKVGKFSQYVKSDFNETIRGAAKAMANFGFSTNDVNKYLESSHKTMSTALVTYDQLAKVQSDFAGAAKGAAQDYNSANQAFALFTVKTKSPEEAATLTKSLFTDLSRLQIQKTFKDVLGGNGVFDKAGKMKQFSQIVTELNHKLLTAKTDYDLSKIRGQFQGSEGLNALLAIASDRSGQTLATLKQFDNVEVDFSKIKENAENNLGYVNEMINNRLRTSMVRLGETAMPTWMVIKKNLILPLTEHLQNLVLIYGRLTGNIDKTTYHWMNINHWKDKELSRSEWVKGKEVGYWDSRIDRADKMSKSEWDKTWGELDDKYRKMMAIYKHPESGTEVKEWAWGNLEAFKDIRQRILEARGNPWAATQANTNDKNKNPATPTGDDLTNKITGSAKQIKTININIDSFVKGGINTQNTTLQKMDERQIEAYLRDMFMRVIANVETAYQ